MTRDVPSPLDHRRVVRTRGACPRSAAGRAASDTAHSEHPSGDHFYSFRHSLTSTWYSSSYTILPGLDDLSKRTGTS